MTFSIQYRTQIKRTRPALYNFLEKTFIENIGAAGGSVTVSHQSVACLFDEKQPGFWLDILYFLEKTEKLLLKAKGGLFGYACVFTGPTETGEMSSMLSTLASKALFSGIWFSAPVSRELESFVLLSPETCVLKQDRFNADGQESDREAFFELQSIKEKSKRLYNRALYETVSAESGRSGNANTCLTGRAFTGKREILHLYVKNHFQRTAPLVIRFREGISPVSCFVDVLTPALCNPAEPSGGSRNEIPEGSAVKTAPAGFPEVLPEELAALHKKLFRERLRREASPYTLKECSAFVKLLFSTYCKACAGKNAKPVLILENLQNAGEESSRILIEALGGLRKDSPAGEVLILGTYSDGTPGEIWREVFANILCCEGQPRVFNAKQANRSLLELVFAVSLFGKYFPPSSIPELLCEAGKSKSLIAGNLRFLYQNNIISSPEAPEPEFRIDGETIEELLGERADYIKKIAEERLLDWTAKGKFAPCYNLLEYLHSLGCRVQDGLLLESVTSDIYNGTYSAIEGAVADGSFNRVAGGERAGPLLYCFVMLKNFLYGSGEAIKNAYRDLKQYDTDIPVWKAEILSIETRYRTALRDTRQALNAAKKSFVLIQGPAQGAGGSREIARVYRLFALANMTGKEINDAIDYLSFALDIAERNRDYGEMAVSAYYSAAVHFIFGNLSKTERLLKLSCESALNSSRISWERRARFFLGRYYFETGRYREALAVFDALYKDGALDDTAKGTVNAWLFRTELYLNLFDDYAVYPGRELSRCADGMLFEIEALCLTGEYSKCIELAGKFPDLLKDDDFLFLEQPDWASGFAQCELIEYSLKDFFTRMCSVWSTLALCKTDARAAKDALQSMQKIMRNERSGVCDPNTSFYLLANYIILKELNFSEVDKNTAISMAFKRLQSRASRIDDIETRRVFLCKHYWNKILSATAKDHKLI